MSSDYYLRLVDTIDTFPFECIHGMWYHKVEHTSPMGPCHFTKSQKSPKPPKHPKPKSQKQHSFAVPIKEVFISVKNH